ncbi:MAG: VanZ family protein [Deltaproteobacteria bacterium]
MSEKPLLMTGRRRFSLWAPAVAYAAFIFFLSSLQGSGIPTLFSHADKIEHILLYLPFGFLVGRALGAGGRRGALRVAFFVVSLYALSDEFHQLFVPERTFSLWDWAADIVGAAAGIRLYHGKNRSFSQHPL